MINLCDIIEKNIVFISTTGDDMLQCQNFSTTLRKNGIYHWSMFDNFDHIPNSHTNRYQWTRAMNFDEKIKPALACTSVFVLLVSENIFEVEQDGSLIVRPEIEREIDIFIDLMKKDERLVYFPVLLFDGNSITKYVERDDKEKPFNLNQIKKAIKLPSSSIYLHRFSDSDLINKLSRCISMHNDYKIGSYIENLELSTSLLKLQNECIQKEHITNKISDYILTSGEISSNSEFAEIHIMSNELQHYDCTTISSLAIAMNIQRKMKYIYYLPECSKLHFNILKERARHFIKRDDYALKEIDSWLRSRLCEEKRLFEFIDQEFSGSFAGKIIEYFQYLDDNLRSQIRKALGEIQARDRQVTVIQDVKDWVSQSDNYYNLCEVKRFIDSIKEINRVIFDNGVSNINNVKASETYEQFDLLIKLYDFSSWLLGDASFDSEEISRLLDFMLDDNVIPKVSQIRDYLTKDGTNMLGATHEDDASIEEIISQNIVGIDISKMTILKPCYSFCLYIKSERDISIAWYTCHSNSNLTNRKKDEYIVVYAPKACSNDDCNSFIDAFKNVVEHTPSAREILEKHNSNLLDLI